jgi:uncharacterized peroxidase-related enzyme
LRELTKDADKVRALIANPVTVELPPRQRALVDYAIKLTRQPARMQESDLQPMRDAGLDDRAILDANMVCGYFAFVNRVADGLGVPLETDWDHEPNP